MKTIQRRGEVVLRTTTEADLPALDQIAIACWRPIYASTREQLGDELYTAVHGGPDDWQAGKCDQVRRHFAHAPDRTWVVAQGDSEPFAFITFNVDPERGLGVIGNNGVHPEHAGRGWGTFMYRAVLAHFQELGLRVAQVMTGLDDAHAPARRAYEAAGFDHRTDHCHYWLDLATWPAERDGENG